MRDRPLQVAIEDGEIVIRLGVDMLASGVEHCSRLEEYNEKTGEYVKPKVTDHDGFAAEVLRVLQDEEEDGTTPLHLLFDRVALAAIEDGAEGIEIPGVYP